MTDHSIFVDSSGKLFNGGWYTYKDGTVEGPCEFNRVPTDAWVSRQGLDRWYRWSELPVRQEVKPGLSIRPNIFFDLGPDGPIQQETPWHPSPDSHYVAKVQFRNGLVAEEITSSHEKKPIESKMDRQYSYAQAKDMHRLGSLIPPFKAGIGWWTISLGLYSRIWAEQVLVEISYHENGNLAPTWVYWLTLIPGLSVIPFVYIGKKVRDVQVNGSKLAIGPLYLLGLFPPLAIIYVQKSLNQFWFQHIHQPKNLT